MKMAGRILRAVVSAFVIAGAFIKGDTVDETVKIVEEWKASNKAACSSYVIKTYINVIQKANGIGNISPTTIANQMNVLNAAYASMGFQFTYLPSEIVNVANDAFYTPAGGLAADDANEFNLKDSYHRGGLHNLNIYFHNDVAGTDAAGRGRATRPGAAISVARDGVVVESTTVPGGSLTDYNAGDTLVNVVGRWLGLFPVYFDSTNTPGTCPTTNDGVDDTPKQILDGTFVRNGLCPINQDSCPESAGIDSINNYMDDTTDACRTSFTAGQKVFAQALFDTYRNPSCGAATCCAASVPPPVAPTAPAPVPTAPVTAPVAAPTPSAGSCFSGANSVVVQGKGVVSMESVQIGDRVETSNGSDKFSTVYSFAHVHSETEVEYLQIYTDESAVPLEISHNHFIHITDVKVARAGDIKVGDMLGKHKVTVIETVTRRGLYNPVTESGDIVVSGVHASCYASVLDVDPTVQAYATHAMMSMLRVACSLDFSICQNESYNEDGYSSYLVGMIKLTTQATVLPILVQMLLVIICSPLLLGLVSLEMLIQSSGVLVAMLGAFVLHRKFLAKNTAKAKIM